MLCSYAEAMKSDVSKITVWLKKGRLEDKETALLMSRPLGHILRVYDAAYSEEETKPPWIKYKTHSHALLSCESVFSVELHHYALLQ